MLNGNARSLHCMFRRICSSVRSSCKKLTDLAIKRHSTLFFGAVPMYLTPCSTAKFLIISEALLTLFTVQLWFSNYCFNALLSFIICCNFDSSSSMAWCDENLQTCMNVSVGARTRGQNGTMIVNCDPIKCMLSTGDWWISLFKNLIMCC